MINISNTMVESILNKSRLSRTDLSTLYKKIKELKLNVSWLDLFRKSTREASLSTLQQAIKPKPKKTNQLKELLKTIKNTKPESNDYYILTIQFTDGSKNIQLLHHNQNSISSRTSKILQRTERS